MVSSTTRDMVRSALQFWMGVINVVSIDSPGFNRVLTTYLIDISTYEKNPQSSSPYLEVSSEQIICQLDDSAFFQTPSYIIIMYEWPFLFLFLCFPSSRPHKTGVGGHSNNSWTSTTPIGFLDTVKLGYIKLGFYEYIVYIKVLSRPERNPIDFHVK